MQCRKKYLKLKSKGLHIIVVEVDITVFNKRLINRVICGRKEVKV